MATGPKTKYIYDLPYREREELCRILDIHETWKSLGGHMKFNTLDIQGLEHLERRGKSPSDELLTKWSLQNHTVQELFVLLSRIHHFQAMSVLKSFVEPEYHHLMYEGEDSITRLLRHDSSNLVSTTVPYNGDAASSNKSGAVAASLDKTFGGHNLNVMLPEAVKLNKKGFAGTDKIQNIRNHASFEENIPGSHPQMAPSSPRTPVTPGSSLTPPVLVPNAMSKMSGGFDQLQLSPVGIGVLSAGSPTAGKFSNTPMHQQHMDLPVPSAPQRKLSDGSMATLQSEYQSVLPMHDYKVMEAATNGWDSSNIIGKGGFGIVFKGVLKNSVVAIKRIEPIKGDSRESQEVQYQQSIRELQVLQKMRHDNILQLYSFSFNGDQPCLVYKYMEQGSLEDRLQCRNRSTPLTWPQRYNIAKGSARGLQYLHTVQEKPLIHGDIKSANILLDSNFEPHIGDFGLAREGPKTQYTHMKVSRVHGTRPYLPEEFLRNKKLSTKVDTYSFGVVLFELATGLRAYDDKRSEKFLKDEVINHRDVVQLMDPKAGKAPSIFSTLIDIGKHCVSKLPKDRPEMTDVYEKLNLYSIPTQGPTPMELQLYYDQRGQRKLSIGNSPHVVQPSTSQPPNSISRQPANLSSYPPNGLAMTGQPSSVSGIPQVLGASQGIGISDTSANGPSGTVGQVSNAAVNSRPSVFNHVGVQNPANPHQPLNVDFCASPKASNGFLSPTSGNTVPPIVDPLLPTVLPAGLQATLLSPAISIMPPTGSQLSANSTQSSLSESSIYDSHESQFGSAIVPKESERSCDEQGPLPLLSVLGIRDEDSSTIPNSPDTAVGNVTSLSKQDN